MKDVWPNPVLYNNHMSITDSLLKSVIPSSFTLKKDESYEVPVTDKLKEVPPNREVLISWESLSRPYKELNKEFLKKRISFLFIISIFLVLAGQFLLIGVGVSVFVLYYVLSSVPPGKVKHEIDNYGIFYLDKQFYWNDLKFYFLTSSDGVESLCVDTKEAYPGRLFMILDSTTSEKVKEIMSKHLPLRKEEPQSVFDKLFKNFASKISF